MSAQRPFDPTQLLAAHLHAKVCPGHQSIIEPLDCLIAQAALADFVAELEAAGLALVPAESVRFLQELYANAVTPEPLEEVAPVDANQSRARAHAPTWILLRYRDGRTERGGPHQRWLAELLLHDLGFTHDADVVAARLEGEPAWVDDLLRELGDQAA